MADVFTAKKRSVIMAGIKSQHTVPEKLVRSALHSLGYRFRLHAAGLPGKPDILLPRHRVAVQVRGCFWHGHTCFDGHIPRTRRNYWLPKIRGNKRRDALNDRRLRDLGWSVIVVWACKCEVASRFRMERVRIERFIERTAMRRRDEWSLGNSSRTSS